MHYKLVGHQAVPVNDLIEWARWFETADLRVALTELDLGTISTVFCARVYPAGRMMPALFETMVFGGEHNEYQERYSTWDEAEAGHKRVVEMVRKSFTTGTDSGEET